MRHPLAPASTMLRTVLWPARRKYQPRSRALANFEAITCALSAGRSISSTCNFGFSRLKSSRILRCSSLITLPRRPITIPTLSAWSVTLVQID